MDLPYIDTEFQSTYHSFSIAVGMAKPINSFLCHMRWQASFNLGWTELVPSRQEPAAMAPKKDMTVREKVLSHLQAANEYGAESLGICVQGARRG
jgi:hypothetical protein